MPLAAGTRLGAYEILAPLGAGGMGEVYRARDTRLGREVAVKVLPASLSSSAEVRARFEREARTVSSLNHPHICTLFDVGREADTDYLVMELVEGETLAQRLARGALPTPEVLKLGGQIADALDRAHRAGVIHRDLKPGNVMLTRSGAKLMDFGLARAIGLAGPAGASGMSGGLSQSPTMAQPLTAEGTIVGTFQYMAPEQLEGREADARSDLWALGCVLYEMATGRRAFEGKSQASLIGAIMHKEAPSLAQAAPATPPGLDRLIQACLAKDPEERIQTAHDVSLQLRWLAGEGSQAGAPAPAVAPAAARPPLARLALRLLPIVLTALVVIVAQRLLFPPAPAPVLRFGVPAAPSLAVARWPMLSPDGRTLAFLGTDSAGAARIWLRPLDALEAHPLPGVHAERPFWSFDGRSLGYIAGGKLHRIELSGGAEVTLAETPGGADGSWGDGVVLYDGSGADSIRRVTLAGGKVEAASTIDRARGETGHAWPSFLPDGRHFLFVAIIAGQTESDVKLGTLGSLASRTVGHTDSRAQYAPPGYLLTTSGGTLLARRFDARSGRTSGEVLPIAQQIAGGTGNGDFTISRNGVLAYRVGASSAQSRLVWVDRAGRMLGEAAPPDRYDEIRLSPDGTRVAARLLQEQGANADIWIRDLARGVTSRITFGSSDNLWPTWSPDGARVAYASNRGGEYHTLIRSASGAGGEDSLPHERGGNNGPTDWSADGRTIAVSRLAASGWDLWIQSTDARQAPNKLLQTPFNERFGRISPDGRWLAYASNESGRYEIYVMPLAGGAGKWQISTGGGDDPFWRAGGRELLYRGADRTINSVTLGAGPDFEPGTPQTLFRVELTEGPFTGTRWCPTADAQRFLLEVPAGGAGGTTFNVVSGWPAELRRKP